MSNSGTNMQSNSSVTKKGETIYSIFDCNSFKNKDGNLLTLKNTAPHTFQSPGYIGNKNVKTIAKKCREDPTQIYARKLLHEFLRKCNGNIRMMKERIADQKTIISVEIDLGDGYEDLSHLMIRKGALAYSQLHHLSKGEKKKLLSQARYAKENKLGLYDISLGQAYVEAFVDDEFLRTHQGNLYKCYVLNGESPSSIELIMEDNDKVMHLLRVSMGMIYDDTDKVWLADFQEKMALFEGHMMMISDYANKPTVLLIRDGKYLMNMEMLLSGHCTTPILTKEEDDDMNKTLRRYTIIAEQIANGEEKGMWRRYKDDDNGEDIVKPIPKENAKKTIRHLIIDNSNLCIEGSRVHGISKCILNDDSQEYLRDNGWMLDYKKLLCLFDCNPKDTYLFGSKCMYSTEDDHMPLFNEMGINASWISRQGYKEKRVDVKIAEKLIEISNMQTNKGVTHQVVLISGDGDFCDSVTKLINKDIKVFICSWSRSFSHTLKKIDQAQHILLDPYHEYLTKKQSSTEFCGTPSNDFHKQGIRISNNFDALRDIDDDDNGDDDIDDDEDDEDGKDLNDSSCTNDKSMDLKQSDTSKYNVFKNQSIILSLLPSDLARKFKEKDPSERIQALKEDLANYESNLYEFLRPTTSQVSKNSVSSPPIKSDISSIPSSSSTISTGFMSLTLDSESVEFEILLVSQWLRDLGLQEYVTKFEENGYDNMSSIIRDGLDEEDFDIIGIKKKGHIKSIVKDIKRRQRLTVRHSNNEDFLMSFPKSLNDLLEVSRGHFNNKDISHIMYNGHIIGDIEMISPGCTVKVLTECERRDFFQTRSSV